MTRPRRTVRDALADLAIRAIDQVDVAPFLARLAAPKPSAPPTPILKEPVVDATFEEIPPKKEAEK